MRADLSPESPPIRVEKGVSGTESVHGPNPYGSLFRRWSESAVPDVIPAWLKDARNHVPPWAESVLYALHGAGFRLPGGEP